MRRTLSITMLTAACLALLAAGCAAEEDDDEDLRSGGSPTASPTATASDAREVALREAVTAYQVSFESQDFAALYAAESAELRAQCSLEVYEELLSPLWPDFLDECGYEGAPELEFTIKEVQVVGDQAAVLACQEDENGRECCYYQGVGGSWDYRDGRWAPANALPCTYAQENNRLLASLPELPGAEQVAIDPYMYSRGEVVPPDRHGILVTYKAPPEVSAQDVIDFYVESLAAEWQHNITSYGGPSVFVDFTRGTEAIQVDLSNMAAPVPTFNVHVDYRGAEPQ